MIGIVLQLSIHFISQNDSLRKIEMYHFASHRLVFTKEKMKWTEMKKKKAEWENDKYLVDFIHRKENIDRAHTYLNTMELVRRKTKKEKKNNNKPYAT